MRQLVPIVFLIAIALVAVFLLRRTLRRLMASERAQEAEKVLPFLIGTVGGYYGLLTGFVLSLAWGDVQAVRNSTMAEINALADIARIGRTIPGPIGVELKRDAGGYLRSVIDYDMQAMAQGRVSPETTAAFDRLWSTAAIARPDASAWENSMLGRALNEIGIVGEQRRIRILISTETLPAIVWAILLIGGAIIILGATLVCLRYSAPAREILVAVVAMLSIVLFAIYSLDRPFRHGFAPGEKRYELLWEAFNTIDTIPPQ